MDQYTQCDVCTTFVLTNDMGAHAIVCVDNDQPEANPAVHNAVPANPVAAQPAAQAVAPPPQPNVQTCPICNVNFPLNEIGAHAAQCGDVNPPANVPTMIGGVPSLPCPICMNFLPVARIDEHAAQCGLPLPPVPPAPQPVQAPAPLYIPPVPPAQFSLFDYVEPNARPEVPSRTTKRSNNYNNNDDGSYFNSIFDTTICNVTYGDSGCSSSSSHDCHDSGGGNFGGCDSD